MAPESPRIEDLAQAVLDGDQVDWTEAESKAVGSHQLVRHLRIVAAVANVHRETSGPSLHSQTASPAAPEIWGHLRIVEHIGSGAFGQVYRAWDTRLEREVALKLIPVAGTQTAGTASSMIREGRLLARVHHPNVVTIYGADHIGGHVGLWMEFVRGRTLEELLRTGTTFEPSEVTRIGLELGRALAAVHASGLLHRDIKAQNVMRADDGRIVLMDFGAGRELADGGKDVTGTPLYLAPEVFQGRDATAQSDIYSLGVLLYHLLTNSYPVHGRAIRELRDAHQANTRTELASVRPLVPSPLARIIRQATDPRVSARYPGAEALCDSLESAITVSRWRRRSWYGVAAAAALALATWLTWGFVAPAHDVLAVHFENLARDPGDVDLVNGFMFELKRRLGALERLRVRSVLSSASLENEGDAQTFGRQLEADLVLDVTLSRPSRSWHVRSRLIDVGNGAIRAHLPTDDNENLLPLLNQISQRTSETLGREFQVGRYTTTAPVYDQFLRARSWQVRGNPGNTETAAGLFLDAYTQDRSFTPALAAWVSAKFYRFRVTPEAEMPELDPEVATAARDVFQRDPSLAEAQAAMGWLSVSQRRWQSARAHFRNAIDLDPGLTTTHQDYFLSTLQPLGDVNEALAVMEAAHSADPQSLEVRRTLGLAQMYYGLYSEAIVNLEAVREQDPQSPYVDMMLGRALTLAGRSSDAIPLLETNTRGWWGYLGYAYAREGRRNDAAQLAARNPDKPARLAYVYAGLGDLERALDALEATARIHPIRAAVTLNSPELQTVRDSEHPRVAALRKRLGLP